MVQSGQMCQREGKTDSFGPDQSGLLTALFCRIWTSKTTTGEDEDESADECWVMYMKQVIRLIKNDESQFPHWPHSLS